MNTVNQQVLVNYLPNCHSSGCSTLKSHSILRPPLEGVTDEDRRCLALPNLLGFTSDWCSRGLNVLESVRTPNSILFPLQLAAGLNMNQGWLYYSNIWKAWVTQIRWVANSQWPSWVLRSLMSQIYFYSMACDYANKSKATSLFFDLVLRLMGRNPKGLSTAGVRVGVGNKTNSIWMHCDS